MTALAIHLVLVMLAVPVGAVIYANVRNEFFDPNSGWRELIRIVLEDRK